MNKVQSTIESKMDDISSIITKHKGERLIPVTIARNLLTVGDYTYTEFLNYVSRDKVCIIWNDLGILCGSAGIMSLDRKKRVGILRA